MNDSARPDRYHADDARPAPPGLHVDWRDGHHSEYHAIWLRHQCECEQCGTPVDGIRNAWILDLPEQPEIDRLETSDHGVSITWKHDGHESVYGWEWLRRNCYSDAARRQRKHRPALWDHSIADRLPEFDCRGVEADDHACLEFLEAVRDYGFCKFDNMGESLDDIRFAAGLFGKLRDSYYGISDITEKSAQYNVGDSGRALLPHVDEAYRINPIGITLFQVVRPSDRGGHSILVDGFEAARRLRDTCAESFDLLSRTPVIFRRRHVGETTDGRARMMMYSGPVIRLDADGDVAGVRINERQISPLNVAGHLVEPFYRAIRKLLTITYDPALRLELPLGSGQGMAFDNQRVLHGRTEFVRGKTPRHVRTCTVDTEEFHSTLRLLQMKLGRPESDQLLAQGY